MRKYFTVSFLSCQELFSKFFEAVRRLLISLVLQERSVPRFPQGTAKEEAQGTDSTAMVAVGDSTAKGIDNQPVCVALVEGATLFCRRY